MSMPRTIQTVSRRGFIKRAALLAAAAAVPTTIPCHALRSAVGSGANDRVRIGCIGAGRRAKDLREGLPSDAQIVAIADCNLPAAEATAATHKCRAYQNYRKMLESDEIDAVVIATPDHWHTLPAIHACQALKDVYLEKPMTLTIREGRQLVTAVRKYQRVLQTGSQQRSIALNRLGCELVRNGAIGRVQSVIAANYESPWECALPAQPVPTGLDWDTWCGQTDAVPYNKDIQIPRANPGWISFRPWSGGEMTGWGAHGFDQIQWALDMNLTGPVEIWTEGEPFQGPTYTQPGTIEDGNKTCSRPLVRFRYANDVVVNLDDKGQRGGGKFIGEKGTLTLDRNYLQSDPPEIVAEALKSGDFRTPHDTGAHMANWIACIRSRALPVADVEIGHRSTTVCHLGNIARWTGRKLQWDPDKEQFVGDDAANQLLSRPQRKGFEIPDSP
jgi:predicted dehydrogenase